MPTRRISDRKLIIFTAGLLVFSGLIKLMSYTAGLMLFYLSFLPYIFYRASHYLKSGGRKRDQIETYRMYILIVMVVSIFLNIIGWQSADFFLLFLLMLDLLLVINRPGTGQKG